MLLVGWQEKLSGEVLAWLFLERAANDLHMVQLMPLPPIVFCFIKIQNGLPFRLRLTQVVLVKRPFNGRSVVVEKDEPTLKCLLLIFSFVCACM